MVTLERRLVRRQKESELLTRWRGQRLPESGGMVSGGCDWVSFLRCAGNNGATWGGRGTTVGARGETGQDTKRELASTGRTYAGEGGMGLVRTQKKGVSRGDGREEQRDDLEKSSIQSEPTADRA